ncbi:MAG: hypothetical protein NT023_00915, partial [Armatimonadetes bacterium]|nr:hypothetical protein [Armatimonadota bacterium]
VVDALYDSFDDDKPLTTESIIKAIRNTVPLAMTMQERIEGLRQWAEERARPASSVQSEDLQTIREELIIQKHQELIVGTSIETPLAAIEEVILAEPDEDATPSIHEPIVLPPSS